MSEFTFTEEQRFSRNFVFPFVIFITAITAGMLYWGLVQQLNTGKPVSVGNLLFSSIFPMIIVLFVDWLLIKAKLVTEINRDTIRYRFYPFILRDRFIYWQDIEKAYVRKYKPILEYGGWGIRFGIGGKGRALNVKGKYGLQLVLKSGKKLLLGTQKPQELEQLLQHLGKSGS